MNFNSLDANALNNSGAFQSITDALRGIGESYMRNKDRQLERETLRDQAMRGARWRDLAVAREMAKDSGVAPQGDAGYGLGESNLSALRAMAAQRSADIAEQAKQREFGAIQRAFTQELMPLQGDLIRYEAGAKGLAPAGYEENMQAAPVNGPAENVPGNSLRSLAMGSVEGSAGESPQAQGYSGHLVGLRAATRKQAVESALKTAQAQKALAEAQSSGRGVKNYHHDATLNVDSALIDGVPHTYNAQSGRWEPVRATLRDSASPAAPPQSQPAPTSFNGKYPDGEFNFYNPADYFRAAFGRTGDYQPPVAAPTRKSYVGMQTSTDKIRETNPIYKDASDDDIIAAMSVLLPGARIISSKKEAADAQRRSDVVSASDWVSNGYVGGP